MRVITCPISNSHTNLSSILHFIVRDAIRPSLNLGEPPIAQIALPLLKLTSYYGDMEVAALYINCVHS